MLYEDATWETGPVEFQVKALDWWLSGREFEPQPLCCLVTTLGKLFTPMCVCHQAVGTGQWVVTLFGWEGSGSLPPGGWLKSSAGWQPVTPGSAPGLTLGNEYGRTLALIDPYPSPNFRMFCPAYQNSNRMLKPLNH